MSGLRDQFLDSMSFVAVKISSGMHPLEVEEEVADSGG